MKNRYWMKLRYGDGHERWELTAGKYAHELAVRRAYEARGKSLHFEIVEVTVEEN